MDTKYIIGIVAVILIAIIAGAVLMGGSSTQRADDELVVAAYSHGGEPEAGFDPILGWNYLAEPLIQSTLLKMTPNMTYKNDLASSWEANDNFTEYTVKIKDGIKFTDNTTLDAEDVAFTYNTAATTGASELDFTSLENATATDKNTVVFKLNRPDSTFVDKFAYLGIVPSDSYNNETYGSNPVGSGPYKFVQWDKGQQVILEKNPDYYGKQPEFNKLTILFEMNDAAFNSAKNHEVDVAAVPLAYANETIEGYNMSLLDTIDVRGLSLPVVNNTGNTTEDGNPIGNNVTADKAIREALNYGINRTAIAQGALNGFGYPNYDGIAHQLPWANAEVNNISDGDVDRAKEILAQGGWNDTDGDGIVEKDGMKASINVYYSSDATERQAIAVTISEQAKEFGIEVNATGSNWDEMGSHVNSDPIVWGWGSTDPSTMYNQYYSGGIGQGYSNPASINNSAVDAHINNAMSMDRESSYSEWSAVSWDGSNGISPLGDAAWLWAGEIKYGYFVDNSLDISEDTALLQPHGGDIFSNIYDWHRVSSIEQ
ncbi:MAG: ABC transporter substrate-binding protein [Methanobrevibacter sp.]|jgi:peptide/nickel transport system substrate-binding protein|uniref:ABC transporter substrate-binding protein n=1 Tax=Methanobrevibacter sp. TaxID=66852 RepID=UPI0025EF6D34|nr:ABC transporter substrate-binding protein [Methanobrevibacter sp.]MBE6497633.1 ABC transporter substrate-binding protein [Methanobrevibacter sp.]